MKKQERKGWWARISSTTMAMAFAFAFGVLFLVLSYRFDSTTLDYKLMHDIGIAFTVAGLLGVGVDQALRKGLAEDAFKASIGYLLPDELKGEMEWIYSTHTLCVEHNQTCKLQPIDDDTCTIHVHTIRKFRNISSSTQTIMLGVTVDEWFHETGESKILVFGYTKLGTRHETYQTTREPCSISVKAQEIHLAPNEEVVAWWEAEEIKRRNDVLDYAFNLPTLNPTVTVTAFEGIAIDARFGYRSKAEKLGSDTYRVSGTLLPNQRIQVRWWEKEKANTHEQDGHQQGGEAS